MVEQGEGPSKVWVFPAKLTALLLEEERIGGEAGQLEQVVVLGAAEGGAADNALEGDVAGG